MSRDGPCRRYVHGLRTGSGPTGERANCSELRAGSERRSEFGGSGTGIAFPAKCEVMRRFTCTRQYGKGSVFHSFEGRVARHSQANRHEIVRLAEPQLQGMRASSSMITRSRRVARARWSPALDGRRRGSGGGSLDILQARTGRFRLDIIWPAGGPGNTRIFAEASTMSIVRLALTAER